MQNVVIRRYNPALQSKGWAGVVEAEDRSWTLFIDSDGVPALWLHRAISEEEAIKRGFAPYDPETSLGIGGEYVPAGSMPDGERPTPNRPLPAAA